MLFKSDVPLEFLNKLLFVLFQTRLAYLEYMTKVGKLLGGGNTTRQQMEKVLELEGKLANVSTLVVHEKEN